MVVSFEKIIILYIILYYAFHIYFNRCITTQVLSIRVHPELLAWPRRSTAHGTIHWCTTIWPCLFVWKDARTGTWSRNIFITSIIGLYGCTDSTLACVDADRRRGAPASGMYPACRDEASGIEGRLMVESTLYDDRTHPQARRAD
jgi:hypothetical protein